MVLAEDETHLNLLPHVRAGWTRRGARPQIPTPGQDRQVIAVMDVSELTGYSRAGAAGPNVTDVARVNPVPVVVTIVPPADVARRL